MMLATRYQSFGRPVVEYVSGRTRIVFYPHRVGIPGAVTVQRYYFDGGIWFLAEGANR